MKLAKILIILFAIVVVGLGIWTGYSYNTHKKGVEAVGSSTIFSPPQDIAAFSLVDTKGRPFNNNSLWGHWTLMFFGFTSINNLQKISKIRCHK
jgi:protein SCO1